MLKLYDKDNIEELYALLERRADSVTAELTRAVSDVICDVRENGDEALYRLTEKFDKMRPESLILSEAEKRKLLDKVPLQLRRTMERAAENIFAFHEKQKQNSRIDCEDGRIMGQRVIPLKRVGLYVPGGTAAYPSSVLMNAIPAKVAGVDEIVITTPPKSEGISPAVVCAADIAGVKEIITVGGAQAVAALAYGTQSVRRVDKIVGPGNIFVAIAKRLVFGSVDIDMFAGPSEVLVIADESADPAYLAADLMSQAEHDPMAASILIATSEEIINKVNVEIEKQLATLSRGDIIRKSLESYGSAVVVSDLSEAAAISDVVAPEHLELAVAEPFELLPKIRNAGSVFLGKYTPEPLGDYYAGPNHVLPTNGTARFSSPLSVDSFVKKSSFLYYEKSALLSAGDDIISFAQAEGLDAHANSIKVRMRDK